MNYWPKASALVKNQLDGSIVVEIGGKVLESRPGLSRGTFSRGKAKLIRENLLKSKPVQVTLSNLDEIQACLGKVI